MKKTILLPIILSCFMLTACGSKTSEELENYRVDMAQFFGSVAEIGDRMDAIDPDAEDYKDQMKTQLAKLETAFADMADAEVPKEFESLGDLPTQAKENMTKAKELYEQILTDGEYDEDVAYAADEYYARANQRVKYIITILHGELPEGDGVSVTY